MTSPRSFYVLQPTAATNEAALGQLLGTPGGRRLDIAIAYVTNPGVTVLETAAGSLAAAQWSKLEKRVLLGVDWLRSEPTAIDRLAQLPGAKVRIHDGAQVVARSGCVPYTSWHPKLFLLTGARCRAALHGSGNLSGNGMTVGHEVGAVLSATTKQGAAGEVWRAVDELVPWFDALWVRATPWDAVREAYEKRYAAERLKTPVPPDQPADPTGTVGSRRGMTAEQLSALASGQTLWLDVGKVSKNRGPLKPGNQIMMKALTRVFFGASSVQVPQNTSFPSVTVVEPVGGVGRATCTLRFSDNSMDVLTVPVPGSPWPTAYDDRTLQFTKRADGTELVYELRVLNRTQANALERRSRAQGTSWRMQSGGRRWGVL